MRGASSPVVTGVFTAAVGIGICAISFSVAAEPEPRPL